MISKRIIIHVISSDSGGGAEQLVEKIIEDNNEKLFTKEGVFFVKTSLKESKKNCFYFKNCPRSIFNIFYLRRYLMLRVKNSGDSSIIVHSHLTWPLYYVALASIALDVKLVYTEHSTFNKRRNYPILKFIDRFVYSRYEKIIAISTAVSDSLIQWLGSDYTNKVVTIYNGAVLYDFKPRKNLHSDDKLKLLSVGSLKSLKGFETTIRSLHQIKEHIDSYTIVGRGPEFINLQQVAKNYGVDDIVRFVGWSDIPQEYYYEADILLIPSLWEGFSLVAVEGMSTGLPIIASNIKGLNEVVLETLTSSILVSEFQSSSRWSKAICEMKTKLTTNATDMAMESRLQSKRFDIQKMLQAYDKFYKEMG